MGFEEVTVADIANAAGVSRVTFYKHFKDKKDLLMAIVSEVASRLEKVIVPVSLLKDRTKVMHQVTSNMERVLDVVESSPPLFKLLFGGGRTTGGLAEDVLESLEQRMVEVIKRAIQDGLESKLLRAVDPDVASVTLWASFRAAILGPLGKGQLTVEEARKRISNLIDYHLYGLQGAPA